MSEVVATLPQGTQVVLEAKLLTSDVDHAIDEVRHDSILPHHDGGLLSAGGVSRASNRTLFCRKCEGHGQQVVLKGHASRCPYNNCQCKTCTNVMSMRANAIIRRYRTRTLEGGLVLKPVHFKNGNTRLRVFPKYVDDSDALPIPMPALGLREKNPSGEHLDVARNQVVPQTPPATVGQPSFAVKRSYSEELDMSHQRSSSPTNRTQVEQVSCDVACTLPSMQFTLLDLLLKQQGLSQNDLMSNGLLPLAPPPPPHQNMSVLPPLPTTYDSTFLSSFPSLASTASLTYSSPTTYATSFISSPMFDSNCGGEQRRVSADAALMCPTTALSELNIGVTVNSPINSMADISTAVKITPSMFDTSNAKLASSEKSLDSNCGEPEPFTMNLMIAPTADRSHPLFKKFLNTVKELEKNMLCSFEA